jgi:hypothetical protein
VFAGSVADARRLAVAAGPAFVELVDIQEAVNQPSEGDRLRAVVLAGPNGVTKTAPQDSDVWLAAGLAAGVVLVLGAPGGFLGTRRRS